MAGPAVENEQKTKKKPSRRQGLKILRPRRVPEDDPVELSGDSEELTSDSATDDQGEELASMTIHFTLSFTRAQS